MSDVPPLFRHLVLAVYIPARTGSLRCDFVVAAAIDVYVEERAGPVRVTKDELGDNFCISTVADHTTAGPAGIASWVCFEIRSVLWDEITPTPNEHVRLYQQHLCCTHVFKE
jgi:hypothetical protein